jgi:2'-5' RNA ligase
MQGIRTKWLQQIRCGPHFSLLDPFVMPDELDTAKTILIDAFKDIQPFTMVLERINYFTHSKKVMMYLEPRVIPENALNELFKATLNLFPMCNDQVKKGSGEYVPHMSLGRFKKSEAIRIKLELEKNLSPVIFQVKELYIAHRRDKDPFEVIHIVPLGANATKPHFGPGSVPEDSLVARTVVMSGFPQKCLSDKTDLHQFCERASFDIEDAEIILNSDGKPRTIAVLQFKDRKSALSVVGECNYQPYEKHSIYLRLLENMLFPDVIGNSCSLTAIKTIV